MGKRLEQTVLQGEYTEDPETHERMLSITSHQRDANSNHSKIPLHTVDNGHHKQINKEQVLERTGRTENTSALLVGMQTGTAIVENSMEFP